MELSLTFKELGLITPLLNQLEQLDYKTPSPIQAASIPFLLKQKDIMALAQTGTGKTAAFSLPLIQNLISRPKAAKSRQIRSLILSPTRELAQQILANITSYGKQLKLRTLAVYGGVGYGLQKSSLAKGIDILVATPGRLLDLMQQNHICLKNVEALILDEADRMLDMGFLPAIKRIVAQVPKKRHTQLFSATMPDSIAALAQGLLDNPETVMVAPPTSTADKVEQSLCHVLQQNDKRGTLIRLLENKSQDGLTLLFSRTKHGANKLASFLISHGQPAAALHGGKGQGAREKLMKDFRCGKTRILVATDIAARGIDVKNINLVINYDMPVEPEVYIHRIGRTARAEATGSSISLCCLEEAKHLKSIQKLLGIKIPLHPLSLKEPQVLKSNNFPGKTRNSKRNSLKSRHAEKAYTSRKGKSAHATATKI